MFFLIDNFNKNIKIRSKLIILIFIALFFSIVPISYIFLQNSREILIEMTFQICKNLAQNLSFIAMEDLLENDTFDTTQTAFRRLKEANVNGLLNSYVINLEGNYVAKMNPISEADKISSLELGVYSDFKELKMIEMKYKSTNKKILRFVYPILISDDDKLLRAGTALFEFDRDLIYSPVEELRIKILIVSGFVFLFGVILALLTSKIFSKPIYIFAEGAAEIGSGNLNYRIKLTGKDELGFLAKNFNEMTERIKNFTNNLENMVKDRTKELNKSLMIVQELKNSQDGDYYLTSLLLEPLHKNNNNLENIRTHFIIKQNKKFQFKKWKSEIGGDICITDSIVLNHKKYMVFVNGDAMGKSIQGAGGALVLGVVFHSSLMNTHNNQNIDTLPEVWIRDRYIDLHNIFLSFEGTLYISVLMGLIDSETGLMYYINAENPWAVLLRDGNATYIEQKNHIKKIGTPEVEEKFFVKLFQMMSGDSIVIGSDGKDDILKINEHGEEYVSQSNDEFLKFVEKSNGDIEKIVDMIESGGKLMDDLSIMSLNYYKRENDFYRGWSTEDDYIFSMIDELLQKKETLKVFKYLEKYNEFLYKDLIITEMYARVFYLNKEIKKSLECYEYLYMKNPYDHKYLVSLIQIFLELSYREKIILYSTSLILRKIEDQSIYIFIINVYCRINYFFGAKKIIKFIKSFIKDENLILELTKYTETEEGKFIQDNMVFSEAEVQNNFQIAEEYFIKKQWGDALNIYLKIKQSNYLQPNPYIFYKIGICYFEKKELTIALYHLESCLQLDYFHLDARLSKIIILFESENYSLIKNEFQILNNIYPKEPKVLNLKNQLIQKGVLYEI
jgi:HAMP domain-containing protein